MLEFYSNYFRKKDAEKNTLTYYASSRTLLCIDLFGWLISFFNFCLAG